MYLMVCNKNHRQLPQCRGYLSHDKLIKQRYTIHCRITYTLCHIDTDTDTEDSDLL